MGLEERRSGEANEDARRAASIGRSPESSAGDGAESEAALPRERGVEGAVEILGDEDARAMARLGAESDHFHIPLADVREFRESCLG